MAARVLLAVLGVVLLVGGGVATVLWRQRREEREQAAVTVQTFAAGTPSASSRGPAPDPCRLVLRATPTGARLELDGEVLADDLRLDAEGRLGGLGVTRVSVLARWLAPVQIELTAEPPLEPLWAERVQGLLFHSGARRAVVVPVAPR